MIQNLLTLTECYQQIIKGNVIAYPTEAVFGLGCDPDCESAVLRILQLKQRSIEKGLILIASQYEQLIAYIDESTISESQKQQALASWPGPVTWLFPKNAHTPYYLTGQYNTIAVRVTNHPDVKQLCDQLGKPLVSTSANISQATPCRTGLEVRQQFGEELAILDSQVGDRLTPSEIRDIQTGNIIRQG